MTWYKGNNFLELISIKNILHFIPYLRKELNVALLDHIWCTHNCYYKKNHFGFLACSCYPTISTWYKKSFYHDSFIFFVHSIFLHKFHLNVRALLALKEQLCLHLLDLSKHWTFLVYYHFHRTIQYSLNRKKLFLKL